MFACVCSTLIIAEKLRAENKSGIIISLHE